MCSLPSGVNSQDIHDCEDDQMVKIQEVEICEGMKPDRSGTLDNETPASTNCSRVVTRRRLTRERSVMAVMRRRTGWWLLGTFYYFLAPENPMEGIQRGECQIGSKVEGLGSHVRTGGRLGHGN